MDISNFFETWTRLLDKYYRLSLLERDQLQKFYNELRNMLERADGKYTGSHDFPTVQDLARIQAYTVQSPPAFETYVRIASMYPSWLSQQFNIVYSGYANPKEATGRRRKRRHVPFDNKESKKSKKSLRRTLKKFYCK